MRRTIPSDHWLYPALASVAGAIMLLRLAISIPVFSPTVDESSHIGAAVSMIDAHKMIALVEHPPLVNWVVDFPLRLDGADLPQCRGVTTVGKNDLGYSLGTNVLYASSTPMRTLLIHARLAMLVFPAISLAYLYFLGRYLANGLVAFTSVAFFSVDPTLLGHGFWVCTDAAACAGFLAALYYGVRWLRRPTVNGAALTGLVIGLAIAAKFSCVIIVPALALVALAARREAEAPTWKKLLGHCLIVAAVAFVAIWASYQFNIGPLGDQEVLGHPPQWERLPAWIRQTPVPMPSFFLGLARLEGHNAQGHFAYLNGHLRSDGWWYYFPEVLALKSPLGFLAGFLLATGLWIASRRSGQWPARATLIPAGVFLAVSMTGKIDIGIRHLLPIIPLLYLFAAWQLSRGAWVWVLGILIACAAVETAMVHPDYLSFFNLAAGGPANGERFALDSNLDWNQDIYRMADWIKANADGRPYAIRLDGQRNKPLLRALQLQASALDASPHGHLLFISKTLRLEYDPLPWLSRHRPIARIGYSIDVYDLTGPAAADEPDDVPAPDDPLSR